MTEEELLRKCAVLEQNNAVLRGRAQEAERRVREMEFSVGQLSPEGLRQQLAAAETRAENAMRALKSGETRWEHDRKVLEAQVREARDAASAAERRAEEVSRVAVKAIEERAPRPKGLPGVASAVVEALDDFADRKEGVR